jgi:hypothetical protein
MTPDSKFSERHGYGFDEAEICVRHEAPEWLRSFVVRLSYEVGLKPSILREILCNLLIETPDAGNWSEFPNIDAEVHSLSQQAEWFQIYDFIEVIADKLASPRRSFNQDVAQPYGHFADRLNEAFRRKGVGWQLVDQRIQIRGPESFESTVKKATNLLAAEGLDVARHEMHQALADLSRRPTADITGAIQHSMAALECVAREATGNTKATLGELVKKYPDLLPKPLDDALGKIWGFTSERGRHLRENDAPDIREAELVVELAGSITSYLVKKLSNTGL